MRANKPTKGNTMTTQPDPNPFHQPISLDDWVSCYLGAFDTDEKLQDIIDSHGGFAGWVSEGVSRLHYVDGEEANDHECLEHVQALLELYFDACARGIDTQ
jgi:hypothetical protein